MDNEKPQNAGGKTVIWIVTSIVVIFGLYQFIKPKWTLMICDEVMENGMDCYSFASIQENAFTSSAQCVQTGNSIINGTTIKSFECGKSCKHDGIFMVCNTICNRKAVCDN